VAGAGVQVEFVKLLQLANLFERCRAERRLAVEGVQHNAFQHVSERHVVILGKGLEHFENPLFHANPGLHAFDFEFGIIGHVYQCTMVHCTSQLGARLTAPEGVLDKCVS